MRYIAMFKGDDSEYDKTNSFDMHGESGSEMLMRVSRREIRPSELCSEGESSESPER